MSSWSTGFGACGGIIGIAAVVLDLVGFLTDRLLA